MSLFTRFADRLIGLASKRPPDFVIGEPGAPYLLRWWLIPRNRFFNLYLHQFLRSDDPRALHDHPWSNCSVILRGAYWEHLTSGARYRKAGQVVVRRGATAHRVELCRSTVREDSPVTPAWSLFITGPVMRPWGFLCPQGWRHWKDFTSFREIGDDGRGRIGRGCE